MESLRMFPFPLWAGSEMDPSRREREADLSRSQTHVSLLAQKAAGDLAGTDTSFCGSSRPRGRAAPLLFLHSLGRHLGLGGGCQPLGCLGCLLAGVSWAPACWGVSGACLLGYLGRRLLGRLGRGPPPASRWALGTHCTRAFPSLTVHLWGTEEVAAWLEHLSLCEYKDIFTRHDIRGSELLHLERRDLKVLPQRLLGRRTCAPRGSPVPSL